MRNTWKEAFVFFCQVSRVGIKIWGRNMKSLWVSSDLAEILYEYISNTGHLYYHRDKPA